MEQATCPHYRPYTLNWYREAELPLPPCPPEYLCHCASITLERLAKEYKQKDDLWTVKTTELKTKWEIEDTRDNMVDTDNFERVHKRSKQ